MVPGAVPGQSPGADGRNRRLPVKFHRPGIIFLHRFLDPTAGHDGGPTVPDAGHHAERSGLSHRQYAQVFPVSHDDQPAGVFNHRGPGGIPDGSRDGSALAGDGRHGPPGRRPPGPGRGPLQGPPGVIKKSHIQFEFIII